jgi:hypothetical protein
MSQPKTMAAFVDLPAARSADTLIAKSIADAHQERLEKNLSELLATADPKTQALVRGLVGAVATLSAEVATLREDLAQFRRSRSDRIRVDPLQFIPDSRSPQPAQQPSHFELLAASHQFNGLGWHQPERNEDRSWRWSGLTPRASVLLPTLGGRRLRLRAEMLMPFGLTFAKKPVRVLVNDAVAVLQPTSLRAEFGTFQAEIELPEDEGFSNFTLVLQEPPMTDPSGAPGREKRLLGLGLCRIMLERLPPAAGPAR